MSESENKSQSVPTTSEWLAQVSRRNRAGLPPLPVRKWTVWEGWALIGLILGALLLLFKLIF